MGLVGSYHHYIFKAKFHTKDYRAQFLLTTAFRFDKVYCSERRECDVCLAVFDACYTYIKKVLLGG